ncbi:hypothetical protein BH20ACT2_BH20ACT2_03440 [soil metagenome]
MQTLNEAFRVLRDPGRRRAYDRSVAVAAPRATASATPARAAAPASNSHGEVADAGGGPRPVAVIRGLPWVLVLAVLAAIFVFTAYAGTDGAREATDQQARPVSDLMAACVSVGAGDAVREVPCEGPNDGQVVAVVSAGAGCGPGLASVRLPARLGTLCLAPSSG